MRYIENEECGEGLYCEKNMLMIDDDSYKGGREGGREVEREVGGGEVGRKGGKEGEKEGGGEGRRKGGDHLCGDIRWRPSRGYC